MNIIEVNSISQQKEGRYVVKDISFCQKPFQKIAIAGATGSGKTSLLKMIAGLQQPSGGTILFEGERVEGPQEKLLPGHPFIAYLSQYFELRNHYHVEEVLAMANQLQDMEAAAIYEVCRISHLLKRWTHQLSGGEKQRIALASLLVTAPRLLLLDEPFSNLDAIHKNLLKSVIHDIGEALNITCLLVSHDPLDTLSWADDILVLQDGQLIRQGRPEEIYRQPESEYTAALFGKYTVLTPALAKAFSAFTDIEMKAINSFIRPESFKLVGPEDGLSCRVTKLSFMGTYYEAELMNSGEKFVVNTGQIKLVEGDEVFISFQLY